MYSIYNCESTLAAFGNQESIRKFTSDVKRRKFSLDEEQENNIEDQFKDFDG